MSAPAKVTIVVTPTATDDDAGTIAPNVTHTVARPGVLTNDSGSNLTVTSVGPPAHGTVVIDRDGGYRYTPEPGWGGTDTFTYDARRTRSSQKVSAVVTVHVTPPVQLAAAHDDSATGLLSQPVTLEQLVNDVPGDNLAFDAGSVRLIDPVSGLPVLSVKVADGTWDVVTGGIRFTPVPFFVGEVRPGIPRHEHRRADRLGSPDGDLLGSDVQREPDDLPADGGHPGSVRSGRRAVSCCRPRRSRHSRRPGSTRPTAPPSRSSSCSRAWRSCSSAVAGVPEPDEAGLPGARDEQLSGAAGGADAPPRPGRRHASRR